MVRAALEAVYAQLMEGEVSELIGAELGERRPDDRMTAPQRLSAARVANAGGHGRAADPQAAPRQLLPSFLEPRRRSEQALVRQTRSRLARRSQRAAQRHPARSVSERSRDP